MPSTLIASFPERPKLFGFCTVVMRPRALAPFAISRQSSIRISVSTRSWISSPSVAVLLERSVVVKSVTAVLGTSIRVQGFNGCADATKIPTKKNRKTARMASTADLLITLQRRSEGKQREQRQAHGNVPCATSPRKSAPPSLSLLDTAIQTNSKRHCSVVAKNALRSCCHLLSGSIQKGNRERVRPNTCCNIPITLIDRVSSVNDFAI